MNFTFGDSSIAVALMSIESLTEVVLSEQKPRWDCWPGKRNGSR